MTTRNGEALTPRLFPDPPAECQISPSGRHQPVDLSALRFLPTPPFCAWCGQIMAGSPSQRPKTGGS